jgi:prepilin-type N-terminal cleavage/methylation domain-containing protein
MFNSEFRQLREKSSQGLSLIEVCVAIAIVAIILTSLSGMFNQGYRFMRKTRLSQMACLLAQEKMEQLMHEYIFASINSYNASEPLPLNFTRQVKVTYPASEGSAPGVNATMAQVNVTVSWPGQLGVQNFTLISLVSNLTH